MKPQRSPLTQGGLEIKSTVRALWTDQIYLQHLKASLEKNYNIANSNSILNSLKIDDTAESESSDDEIEVEFE